MLSPRNHTGRQSRVHTEQLAKQHHEQHMSINVHSDSKVNKPNTQQPQHYNNTTPTNTFIQHDSNEEKSQYHDDATDLINELSNKLELIEIDPSQSSDFITALQCRAAQTQHDIKHRRLNTVRAANNPIVNKASSEVIPCSDLIPSSLEQRLNDDVWCSTQRSHIYAANTRLMNEQINAHNERVRQLHIQQQETRARQFVDEYNQSVQYTIQCVQHAAQHTQQAKYSGIQQYCQSIVYKIVDLTHNIARYRDVTDHTLVPKSLYNEWINQFHCINNTLPIQSTQQTIDNNSTLSDYNTAINHYINCTSEWSVDAAPLFYVDQSIIDAHPYTVTEPIIHNRALSRQSSDNNINTTTHIGNNDLLGNIIKRIFDINSGVLLQPDNPTIPSRPLSLLLLGKPYCGKKTLAHYLSYKYGVEIVDVEILIKDAVSSIDQYVVSPNKSKSSQLTVQQQLGQRVKKLLLKNNLITDDLYTAIIKNKVDTITSGYVLLNYPNTLPQAKLLETSLSGYVENRSVRYGVANGSADKNQRVQSNVVKPSKSNTASAAPAISTFHAVLVVDATDDQCAANAYNQLNNNNTHHTINDSTLPQLLVQYNNVHTELHTWFSKFNNLHTINGNQSIEHVKVSVRGIVDTVVQQLDTTSVQTHPNTIETSEQSINHTCTDDTTYDVTDITVHTMYDLSVTSHLVQQWQQCESRYTNNISSVFSEQCQHIQDMMQHLNTIRNNYLIVLQSDDAIKDTLIDQFTSTFNDMPNNVRHDMHVKNELHLRTDELCDQLFHSTMDKQKQCETLIVQLLHDNWLDTQCCIIQSYYIALAQHELNKYITTINIIADYFAACKGLISQPVSVIELSSKHVLPLPITPSNDNRSTDKLKSNKPITNKYTKNYSSVQRPPMTVFPSCFASLYQHINNHVLQSAEHVINVISTRVNETTTHINDKNKRRSARGVKSDMDVNNVVGSAYDVLLNNQLTCVIQHENDAMKSRMQLIQRNCECEVSQLRLYYMYVFIDRLDEWLGQRMKSESNAIDILADTIHECIEHEHPIYHKLILKGEHVLIDDNRLVHDIPQLKHYSHYDDHTALTP